MGGYSSEFEISLQSGTVVCASLNPEKYEAFPIHILKEGWFYVAPDGKRYPINKEDFSFNNGSETIVPDIVFNTIHGTPGEDGIMGAYWDLIELKQTSTGFYSAALSFNKRDCLSVLKNFGIKCANSYYVNQGTDIPVDAIIKTVGLPCFVKPSRAGSSFGVSKVHTLEELLPAMEKAYEQDSQIMIETALVGPEISVGLYPFKGEVIALPPTEIVSENDFFDYEAKYLGKSQEITPARISEEATVLVQQEAKKIYQLLSMSGIARTDFILQDGIPHFIETNSNPGLSQESIVPKQVREAGMTLPEFFDKVLEAAFAKK